MSDPTNDKTDNSLESFCSFIDSGIANTATYSTIQNTHTRSRMNSNLTRVSTNSDNFDTLEPILIASEQPIYFNETEEINVLGQRGIWLNRNESVHWRGDLSIEDYPINNDTNPEIIQKKNPNEIQYVQEMAIRYLRPPTPQSPGEILITEEAPVRPKPAPPLIIRQQPPRPKTPEPLVFREEPPSPPPIVPIKRISITGKKLPPPPRKLIIERLPALPAKPRSVIIERWLPYPQVKRKVIYQQLKPEQKEVQKKPKNIIIQWESPKVAIRQELKNLGVIKANPVEYVNTFGNSLISARDMPQYVLDIKPHNDMVLAAEYDYNPIHELEGEIEALSLVDLHKEGLHMYIPQLTKLNRVNHVDLAGQH